MTAVDGKNLQDLPLAFARGHALPYLTCGERVYQFLSAHPTTWRIVYTIKMHFSCFDVGKNMWIHQLACWIMLICFMEWYQTFLYRICWHAGFCVEGRIFYICSHLTPGDRVHGWQWRRPTLSREHLTDWVPPRQWLMVAFCIFFETATKDDKIPATAQRSETHKLYQCLRLIPSCNYQIGAG